MTDQEIIPENLIAVSFNKDNLCINMKVKKGEVLISLDLKIAECMELMNNFLVVAEEARIFSNPPQEEKSFSEVLDEVINQKLENGGCECCHTEENIKIDSKVLNEILEDNPCTNQLVILESEKFESEEQKD